MATELEQLGVRNSGYLVSSSSIRLRENGTTVGFNATDEISTRSSYREIESTLRHRLSSRLTSKSMEVEAPLREDAIKEEAEKLPSWQDTVTVRAILVSIILGGAFCIISLKLGLTTGVIPSLNIAAGLLGYFFCGSLVKLLERMKLTKTPFTKQENTVIQTCIVACYGMAFNGGFGTYLIAMDQQSYENVGDIPANQPSDVYNPTLQRTIPYMFCIAFLGIFFLVPLRNIFILEYDLPYPSGTATGFMINSFFTSEGDIIARKQVRSLFKWFSFSFIFDLWKWFFSGSGDCGVVSGGFDSFPTFSIQAYEWTWYFNFQQNYIGVGMICPPIVDFSFLFGAIISWGIMWPLISQKEGDWYPAGLSSTSFRGLYAYKTFLAIGLCLGDGAYIIVKLLIVSAKGIMERRRILQKMKSAKAEGRDETLEALNELKKDDLGGDDDDVHGYNQIETPEERQLRAYVFKKDAIPWWVGVAGYIVFLVVAVIAVPYLYPPAKWYMCLVAGLIAPLLAFVNAVAAGLTDWNQASLYGKLAILIFSAWGGTKNQGVISGLAVCGIVLASVSAASDLMQDFRTGYLTLSSPRAMFFAQVVGAVLGCVLAPLCFWMFYSIFPVGEPDSLYYAPYGTIYRGIAVLGTEGFSALPTNTWQLTLGFFLIAIMLDFLRDFLPKKIARFVPLPMAMSIPFYLGAWIAIDMSIGGVIILVWQWMDRKKNTNDCNTYAPVIASGLIAGDGIFSILSAILVIAGLNPPICMGWNYAS